MAKKAKRSTPADKKPARTASTERTTTARKPKPVPQPHASPARDLKRGRDEFGSDPSDLRFTDTHEWVRIKDRQTIVVGITDYAQARMSDVTSVELPEPDDNHYEPGDEISIIEALSASTAFHSPISGIITATNTELLSRPELINLDPYGNGWLVEMKPDNLAAVFDLMDVDQYEGNLPEDEEE